MSPFHIKILLHIYAIPRDYEDPFSSKDGIEKALTELLELKLIQFNPMVPPPGGVKAQTYILTDRGRVYVEHLISITLPVHQWVMSANRKQVNL